MADEVRLWEVTGTDELVQIEPAKLDKEDRIEKWILKDISVLDPEGAGLLVIGEQVLTAYGKKIDLLCIDSEGNLVVVELKRDMTPREVTAQALDYASWVQTLGGEEIEKIAAEHLGKSLGETFEAAFDSELPDTLNTEHSIKIVASEIDDSTERIVRYLSGSGIDINVVRFHLFQAKDGRQLLLRTFTVALEEAEQNVRKGSKRSSAYKTLDVRLAESTNQAQKEFLTKRMAEHHATNKRGSALIYRIGNTTRWYLRPRKDRAFVVQIGRFTGDEQLWGGHLSHADVRLRRHGANLGLRLDTQADFQFFHDTATQQGAKYVWASAPNNEDEGGDEEQGEE
jgi:hypothetical protein